MKVWGLFMVREKNIQEINLFCKKNGVNLVNIRNIKKKGKTKIVVTALCGECGQRYDIAWDNFKKQKYVGCCTKCAHKHSQDERRLVAQDLVSKFESVGYKVITPINDIKPVGKSQTFNKTKVLIENKFGYRFYINYNNFCTNIEKFIKDNEAYDAVESRKYESAVKDYLIDLGVPYKREFVLQGIKSKKCGTFRIDFCLYFADREKWHFIEVDERHRLSDKVKDRDKQKEYYSLTNNIPLLRISYKDINNENYKQMIDDFLKAK